MTFNFDLSDTEPCADTRGDHASCWCQLRFTYGSGAERYGEEEGKRRESSGEAGGEGAEEE